jgi:uncharacterized membrane protein (UPF0127 family)
MTTTITINNKTYEVEVFITDEEKETGLQGRKTLDENSGALFVYDEPQEVSFWMKDCSIPLDIIFINEEEEVISIAKGKPNSEDLHSESDVMYVLELNQDSGVNPNDEIDLSNLDEDVDYEDSDDESSSKMLVIGPKGEVQGELQGGERIFSRKHTRNLIRLSKKAYKSKKDSDYKNLGKKMFQYIKTQDTQAPEYVELKN